MSGVTCHFFLLLFLDKVVGLVSGRSVINKANPVSFFKLSSTLKEYKILSVLSVQRSIHLMQHISVHIAVQ